jgi:hypothetical protein
MYMGLTNGDTSKLLFLSFAEENRTHWWSRDIYGSGSSCSLNFLMAAYEIFYITVSINSSKGTTALMRQKIDSEKT